MSQQTTALGGQESVPLFACTKCNSRHPFEDLSQGHQLCKNCKGSFQMIKCNYCRSEFQQEANINLGQKLSSSNICKKCENLQEQHGKPGPCAYCNIIAAFIGTKCQRCTNSEKKYGPPMSCEHCKQKCAFDRKDPESKKKVDGKLLCWLCTITYKRTLSKARQKEAILKSSSSYRHHVSGGGEKPYASSSSSNRHQHGNCTTNGQTTSARHSGAGGDQPRSSSSTHKNHHLHHHRDSSLSSRNKKQRIDLTANSNGGSSSAAGMQIPTMSSLTDSSRFVEPNNGNDLAAVVTQLKDQVAMLNKKLQLKEKDLLAKDKQLAEMKSTNTREQREFREKINSLERQHKERISEMQAKLVTMQKQIASQTKSTRPNQKTGFIEPPLVI